MDKAALVICLGDLGRSPRICNAAKELSQSKYNVCLLGYSHTPVSKEIAGLVTLAYLNDNPHGGYVARQIGRIVSLVVHLATHKPYSLVLIQNPPSVTVLWILLMYRYILNSVLLNYSGVHLSSFKSCRLVVDCHNYGWTLMEGSKMPMRGFFTPILERLEEMQMRSSDRVLTVSKAMRADLIRNRGFPEQMVQVYYDEPEDFLNVPKEESCAVLRKYAPSSGATASPTRLRVITSTSYTPDESVSWLVEAISEIGVSDIELVITGKGPQYDEIRELAEKLSVTCHQIFVDHEDYLKVLASADVGVCLHRSSSGLDLPMKIIDMKNANIPRILAYHYHTLADEADGIEFFKNKDDLKDQLRAAWENPPLAQSKLKRAGSLGRNDKSLVQCLFD